MSLNPLALPAIRRSHPSPSDLHFSRFSELLAFVQMRDWGVVRELWNVVGTLPLPSGGKDYLRNYLLDDCFASLHRIASPSIYIYAWPTGELRFFLVASDGSLIESHRHSLWDACFPGIRLDTSGSFLCPYGCTSHLEYRDSDIVWLPDSPNFTHFLFDSFAPVFFAAAVDGLVGSRIGRPVVPVFRKSDWQSEYLSRLPFQMHQFVGSLSPGWHLIEPRSVLLPIISHQYLSLNLLRAIPFNGALQRDSALVASGKVVLLSRADARRARISNIEHLEDLVRSLNGIIVDPSTLSVSEKFDLLADCSVCIAESSGCINYALYCGSSARLISLIEPSLLEKTEFLQGGWTYVLSYATQKTRFITGVSRKDLPGSPVGQAAFSIPAISAAIQELLSTRI